MSESQANTGGVMEMPKLTPAHRELERLVGTWIGEEKIHPSPFDPAGGTANGRVENRLGLASFFVLQDYEQERNGQVSFMGHGVIGYDAPGGQYTMHWVDSMGLGVSEFRGGMAKGVLTLTAKLPGGLSRATMDFSKTDRYHFLMEMSGDGKAWQTFMEGNYKRLP